MLKLPHFRIARFTPTKIGTNITLEILTEDLPRETRDKLEELWKEGNSLAGIIQDVANDITPAPTKGALVSKLHYLMQQYCQKEGMNFDVYNNHFKKVNHIAHKNELSEELLTKHIESHQAGLL